MPAKILDGKRIADALLEYETLDNNDIDVVVAGGKIERPLPAATKKKMEAAAEESEVKKRPSLPPLLGKKDPTPEPA